MNILLVDDHPLARFGLASSLSYEPDVKNIYEASSVEGAIREIENKSPEITLVDLNLGKEYGLDIVLEAKKKQLITKFVVLTSSTKASDFTRAKELDVDGYILKDSMIEDIIYAIKAVARGKKFYDTDVMKQSMDEGINAIERLTTREKEVLIEIGKGLSNIEIASKLLISEYTVKKHVSNILGKLALGHRTEAAIYVNRIIGK